jgi:pimeloyl-ACP methyl ester carboxylesterase
MNKLVREPMSRLAHIVFAAGIWTTMLWSPKTIMAGEAAATFTGEKTTWHGFDRYDFLMGEDLAIEPTKAAPEEGSGFKHREGNQRRCIVVVPKTAAAGNPWSWQGCYWDHQPQAEVELLKRGFCIGYVEASQNLKPDKSWDAWYAFLTEKHGLSSKPAFVGMSRGGEFAYTWAVRNPDKVSCIYADNPGGNWEVMSKLAGLATNDVPLLHVCGSIDPILGRFTLPIESIYQQFGGRISVMIKEGRGHHPHSLRDPKPIADFIEQSVNEKKSVPPDFVGQKFTRTSYYSVASRYENFPSEQTYITLRGPFFTECYDRYQIDLANVEGTTTIIAPKTPAPGNPWVFRADFVDRNDAVDQTLLAKGFYIVTGAVPYNFDGPVVAQWNLIYKHLTAHGFSAKPVLAGAGGAAGEAYAWAIENPDKVSCIYAENPSMHSNLAKTQPLENLQPLAKAGIPILHFCGSNDPFLEKNTRIAEEQYQKLGGKMKVIVEPDKGHFPLTPNDPKPVVDFIAKAAQ